MAVFALPADHDSGSVPGGGPAGIDADDDPHQVGVLRDPVLVDQPVGKDSPQHRPGSRPVEARSDQRFDRLQVVRLVEVLAVLLRVADDDHGGRGALDLEENRYRPRGCSNVDCPGQGALS